MQTKQYASYWLVWNFVETDNISSGRFYFTLNLSEVRVISFYCWKQILSPSWNRGDPAKVGS